MQDFGYRIYRLKHYAKKYGWTISMEANEIITFVSQTLNTTITINAKDLIIETELIHPKKGETKLLRKGIFTMKIIEKIFINPRAHTPNTIKSQYV